MPSPESTAQVPLPTKASDVTAASTGISMHPDYAKAIARMAYIWGWPLVNQFNRRATITKAPSPGLSNGILPVAPRGQLAMLHDYIDPAENFVTCPNQDVVYGLGFFSLDEEPAVVQVPDFKERFWVYAIYDARTEQFAKIGKPYGSEPGFYLLAGPNWKGTAPHGITAVVRCSTEFADIIPRVFQNDTPEDRKAIQPFINQIVAYPLSQFDGKMKTMDWSALPNFKTAPTGSGEVKWVVPEKFFDQFPEVLKNVPPLPGEEALYSNFKALLDAADHDPAIKKSLLDTAIATEKEVIGPFFQWKHNGIPTGDGWNRSTNNAKAGFDYFNRTGTARSNMFDNKPDETQYFYTEVDLSGKDLKGSSTYSITFPAGQEPPVHGFWSLTLYNDLHLFYPNSLKRYSLGTKNNTLQRSPDGSLTLYAGTKSPGKDKESNWLPAPEGSFSLYIRAYWGKEEILDGSWKPPVVNIAH